MRGCFARGGSDGVLSLLLRWQLLTLASNYKNVPIPYSKHAENTDNLFVGLPYGIRTHMLCMLQPTFTRRVVAEMQPFLAGIDKGVPFSSHARDGLPVAASKQVSPNAGAPESEVIER